MKQLIAIIRELNEGSGKHLRRAALLAALVPVAGALLLGLSGWFIAASAMSGLAGMGLVFDFLRPSGGIRTLTMIRAASRYGERLLGHDATLRALERLRLRLFREIGALPVGQLRRRHSPRLLNRLISDVEALEGVLIRLVFPTISAAIALAIGLLVIWLAAGVSLALVTAAVWGIGVICLARLAGPAQQGHARREEAALQAIRARAAGLLGLRGDLLMQGLLPRLLSETKTAITRAVLARQQSDFAGRLAGVVIQLTPGLAIFATLSLGLHLPPPLLLMVILINLALTECLRLMWRGWSERGRIELAARHLAPSAPVGVVASTPPAIDPKAQLLEVRDLVIRTPDAGRILSGPVSFTLGRGETIAIQAASGAGKSTLLDLLAGLAPTRPGEVSLLGHDLSLWPEPALRATLALVLQRPTLVAGTLAENLRIAAPDASDDSLREAMHAVSLACMADADAGLLRPLGERGQGLSGGETRRLALARAVLRRPHILLVDEPTEGLDPTNAAAVLAGLRQALPDAGIIIVSHRESDLAGADLRLRLPPPSRNTDLPLTHSSMGTAPFRKEDPNGA